MYNKKQQIRIFQRIFHIQIKESNLQLSNAKNVQLQQFSNYNFVESS